jgi:hypothetical protein
LPSINVTDEVIKQLATDSVNRGLTVPGVQKKLSLHLAEEIRASFDPGELPYRLYSQATSG